ncbi:MAG: hypothetical protein AABP62_12680 [Planctomycetota bacterium]
MIGTCYMTLALATLESIQLGLESDGPGSHPRTIRRVNGIAAGTALEVGSDLEALEFPSGPMSFPPAKTATRRIAHGRYDTELEPSQNSVGCSPEQIANARPNNPRCHRGVGAGASLAFERNANLQEPISSDV